MKNKLAQKALALLGHPVTEQPALVEAKGPQESRPSMT